MGKFLIIGFLFSFFCYATECSLVHLQNHAEAEAFVSCIEDKVKKQTSLPNTEIELHLFHVDFEKKINPYLSWALKILSEKGYRLQGDHVTEKELDHLLALADQQNLPSVALSTHGWSEDVAHHVTFFPPDTSVWRAIKRTTRRTFHQLFGASASGFTFFSHFFIRDPISGKLKRKFDIPAGQSQFAKKNAFTSVLWLAGVQLILRNLLNQPQSFEDFLQYAYQNLNSNLMVLSGALYGWVYTTLYYSQSLYSFRKQAGKIIENKGAPQGHQITADVSTNGFLANCILQDILWGQIVLGLQSQMGAVQWTYDEALRYVKNSLFSGASYAGMEQMRGKILEEAAKMESSNPALAAQLREKAGQKGTLFWSFLYPLAFNTALFIPGTFSPVPLIALGIYGLLKKEKIDYQPPPIPFKESLLALPLPTNSHNLPLVRRGCRDLLVLRAVTKTQN